MSPLKLFSHSKIDLRGHWRLVAQFCIQYTVNKSKHWHIMNMDHYWCTLKHTQRFPGLNKYSTFLRIADCTIELVYTFDGSVLIIDNCKNTSGSTLTGNTKHMNCTKTSYNKFTSNLLIISNSSFVKNVEKIYKYLQIF